MRKSTRLVLASGIAILGLTLTGCGGHGRYTQEQTNAAKEKLAQLKAGLLMSLESSSARIDQIGRQTLIYGKPLDSGNEFFPPSSFQMVLC